MMNIIKRYFGYRIIKTVVAATIAIFISQLIGLDYAANSGIIAVISVQSTKRKSIDLAIMRLSSTFLALFIGWVVYSLLGFTAIAFGLYLLIFIPLAVKWKLNEGIIPCSVLVTHLLGIESVSVQALTNELLQMIIGAGIGFIMNLHIPSMEKKLREDIAIIDEMVKNILISMANCVLNPSVAMDEKSYQDLKFKLQESHDCALKEYENKLANGNYTYIMFIEKRRAQFDLLLHMKRLLKRLNMQFDQTVMIAELTQALAENFDIEKSTERNGHIGPYHPHLHEQNNESQYLATIDRYRSTFRNMPLPKTREEFENRAGLYVYLEDLEHFIVQR